MNSNKVVEILQNIEAADQAIVGKSISILSRFAKEKLPVSTGFVLTSQGFNMFLDFSDIRKYYENSRKTEGADLHSLKQAFDSIEFPALLTNEVSKAYAKISGFTDAYVNLRALILDRSSQEISHRSFVIFDIRGEENVLTNIKDLYRDVIFDNEDVINKYFEGELQIVVLAQKALQSEASGVMFTTDVITKDSNKLVIEAVYGLESIVDQEAVIPDQYLYAKDSGEIVEKHISTQEFMAVRQVGGGASSVQKVKISPAWQKRQKLDDKHILTLAKTGQIIEEGMQEPQQVIWSYEAGKVWINFIESSEKLTLKDQEKPTLQEMIDEEVFQAEQTVEVEPNAEVQNGTDVNVHIPEEVRANKNILVDLVLSDESPVDEETSEDHVTEVIAENTSDELQKEPESTAAVVTSGVDTDEESQSTHLKVENIEQHIEKTHHSHKSITKEPLLEGRYFAGGEAQGEVCFDADNCKPNSILVLTGDEDLSASIKVAGFIIEDESDLLADRLHEYFNVPAITGVPLARKILKQGELIQISGASGQIFETVPFSQQIGEIEMNFKTRKDEKVESSSFSFPIEKEETMVIRTEIPAEPVKDEGTSDEKPEEISIQYETSEIAESSPEPETVLKKEDQETEVETDVESGQEIEAHETEIETPSISITPHSNIATKKDISTLLNLVEEDSDMIDLQVEAKEVTSEEVQGVSPQDQFNVWGKSLENIITASKDIVAPVAAEALEHVIDDQRDIVENSKEFTFDTEEQIIAEHIHEEEENKEFESDYLPTATKVYVNLIDEKLPSKFKNFDGIIFSSSFDQDIYLELLEDTLSKAEDKEVLAVCPPYEHDALVRFLEKIYNLRNQGYRNLSLILPDYRNKKEIAEVKKLLSALGLRRSSTFGIFANISRTINVFRINEIDRTMVDGMYVDLFRLKLNMLGVEKLTASTRYVEGMKNMVEYIHENLANDGRTLMNITGFSNPEKVLEHMFAFGFWGIGCSLAETDTVKRTISGIEKKHITSPSAAKTKVRRRI
jgi:phosphohistidine swiveling domain-containing protein